ncbi:hypothetical protein SFRURICE_011359, partial [Spodoptera frugiperda]
VSIHRPALHASYAFRMTQHASHHASIARIFPYKKHSLPESVFTSAKLCVPMNMIGGSQTPLQQRSIAHLWWKISIKNQKVLTMQF